MACKIVTCKVARLKVLADLLNRVRAMGLAVFVDVDLHVWNANRLKTVWSSA